jgi:nucleoside-diphosphate-sugar epimerase
MRIAIVGAIGMVGSALVRAAQAARSYLICPSSRRSTAEHGPHRWLLKGSSGEAADLRVEPRGSLTR